ncbi:apolipoprotein N-acyltransferase [Mycobacterium kubicae]|uniref:apolipoprotein N-acyltransferase n=1 Tax=Mycobacterium kubicae TaxID=120959 RepID=UPI0009EDB31B|nr:apolipoprotein N-acyltransferase [Mycobacterium kubicae]
MALSAAWRRRAPGWLAALVVGSLPALAFPTVSWWWLGWVGLVPLLLLVRTAPTSWDGAVRAWWGLTGFVLTTQYWLTTSIGPLLIVMAAGLGALWLPWGWSAHRLLSGPSVTALLVLPSAWVAAEVVRSLPALGGPWAPLGMSQWNSPPTLASSALGGVWLTSFLVAAVTTAIAYAIVRRDVSGRLVALACATVCVAIGPVWYWLGPTPAGGGAVRIALVQTGDIKDADARQAASEALTATLAGQHVDLVVWGESSVGVDLTSHPDALARLSELSRRVGADLLVNVDAPAPGGGIHKSSVLVGSEGVSGSYRKTRLVPFGEYVPLRPLLGWITRHSKAAGEDRQRGTGPVVLRADGLAIGPLISYETTFSDLARREAVLGADLLAYQSATSSFQGSWAQPQLAAQPAVRAVEAGRPAVHAGLSGDTTVFDARGHLLVWRGSNFRGVAVVSVALQSRVTPYQRLGDWVPILAFVVLGGAIAVSRLRARDTLRG